MQTGIIPLTTLFVVVTLKASNNGISDLVAKLFKNYQLYEHIWHDAVLELIFVFNFLMFFTKTG